ncbi:MAG: hypothetical protein OXC93_02920 [Rhodospirillaceae bacterium]|nr:hypothetical protein [Rhodospirillaceae bacterium]
MFDAIHAVVGVPVAPDTVLSSAVFHGAEQFRNTGVPERMRFAPWRGRRWGFGEVSGTSQWTGKQPDRGSCARGDVQGAPEL